jgi:ribosome-associated protein
MPEKTIAPTSSSPADPCQEQRVAAARQLAAQAAAYAANTRCSQVQVVELTNLSALADYFVIATGTSARQMRSVCQDLERLAEKLGHSLRHASGLDGENWMALDFADVVVHLFSPEARAFYDLDGLWADAPRVPFDASEPPSID